MTTADQLQQVFNANFVAYFQTQVSHVNVQGRNFYSDHKLLGKIYEELQGQVDVLAELIRAQGEFMPTTLSQIILDSVISDTPTEGSADELLNQVRDVLDQLRDQYLELARVADEDEQDDIANYAHERVLALAKRIWMLDSTLT